MVTVFNGDGKILYIYFLLPVCTVRATKPELTVCCRYQQSTTVHYYHDNVRNIQWLKKKVWFSTLYTKVYSG